MKAELRYLEREEIDGDRWDEVISRSQAETLYPYTWYLDAAASRWSALVYGGYEFVMPLVWKKRLGVPYLYQPFYTQQLGVFGTGVADPVIVGQMLKEASGRFRWGRIQFNFKNLVEETPAFRVEDRTNYVLDLSTSYEKHYAGYSTNAKRNLKRALESDLEVTNDLSCEEIVDFKRDHDITRRPAGRYRWLLRLLRTVQEQGTGTIYAARDGEGIVAAAFFACSRRRAIYLVSASSERGKEQRAMFRLVDAYIRAHAGSERALDFEGSVIPSLARFFAGFGAGRETYQAVAFGRFQRFTDRKRAGDG